MVEGLLVVDKPAGMTSHDVVAHVRRLCGQRQVGHAGTLDPLATGVLILCLGRATRLSEYLQAHPKRYQATLRLGETTDTFDADGQVVRQAPVPPLTSAELSDYLQRFRGVIQQRPPAFSAVKCSGVPAYRRARRGEAIDLPARTVQIAELRLLEWSSPHLRLEIVCSAGTYIRSLAHDLGEAIGCGAHVVALRRLASGPFTVADAITWSELEKGAPEAWQKRILPLAAAVADLPAARLDEQMLRAVAHGQAIVIPALSEVDPSTEGIAAGLTTTGDLAAILRYDVERQAWRPEKVFLERQPS